MKKEEKEKLYNLFSVSSSYLNGFRDISQQIPNFQDDIEADKSEIGTETKITTKTANNPKTTGITMEALNEKIKVCRRCQLCERRNNAVPGEGVAHPLVLVVGEGPGGDEDACGHPFVGRAGQLLDKMLIAINLSRTTNCFIANIVKCRPPGNRDPLPDESAACMPYLETQVHLLKPVMILALGRIAAHNLFKTSVPVGKMRGNIYEYKGIPAMMTYHPSALLRDVSLKAPAWEDLKLFRKRLDARIHELALNPESSENKGIL